jgi:hypothetical protein
MARPGYTAKPGEDLKNSRALLNIEPHSGTGGCTPSPRKLRDAATRMTNPILIVQITESETAMFGRTCNRRIRQSEAPRLRAAVTKSRIFTCWVTTRDSRAKTGIE